VPVAVGEVLVVGDEPVRKLVIEHVTTLGLPTRQAESAEAALDAARAMVAVLDCVVLDLALTGSDPWSVLDALRAEEDTVSVPVAVGEVLVVGDEPVRKLVIEHVTTLGLPTRQAESAEAALDAARAMVAVLDCVVLDLALTGSDPWSVLDALRAEEDTVSVPV